MMDGLHHRSEVTLVTHFIIHLDGWALSILGGCVVGCRPLQLEKALHNVERMSLNIGVVGVGDVGVERHVGEELSIVCDAKLD